MRLRMSGCISEYHYIILSHCAFYSSVTMIHGGDFFEKREQKWHDHFPASVLYQKVRTIL